MTANYVAIARGDSEGRVAAWLHSTFSNARLPVLENWRATPSNILAFYGAQNFITYSQKPSAFPYPVLLQPRIHAPSPVQCSKWL